MPVPRRQFLVSAVAAASSRILQSADRPIRIAGPEPDTFLKRLAPRELLRGLSRLYESADIRIADRGAAAGGMLLDLRVDPSTVRRPEQYRIEASSDRVSFTGGSDRSLLYAIFDFLERQGVFHGIDGESQPYDPAPEMILPRAGQAWEASPRFATRGLLPWPDFLNCISVYNEEDFRAYFENMLRMRFNTFGMHVYTQEKDWAESYLSFEYAGVGHNSFLDNTASRRWGYLPQRTSTFGMGAAEFFDAEAFGSDATRLGRDPWERRELTRSLLRKSLDYAHDLGIRTGVGFEPYQIPDEIWQALPPEVRREGKKPRFDVESVTARDLLETRLGNLLEWYPGVDHVWLWEDEGSNWESRKEGVPLSVTPFVQAHDFLRRHAPDKRLVLGGWGGVARNFGEFHKRLPGDIIFTCLSDSLGWDPLHEVFGKLEGRERWPIPWLEDDPSMWLPQFHVNRFERDMKQALDYGCQGMLGIHWRHRIVDPNAGFLSRFSWDPTLKLDAYYAAYARTQAAGPRSPRLAQVLSAADRDRKLLATSTGEVKDGHVVSHEWSGDYNEGFLFWNDYKPSPEVLASGREVAEALEALAKEARTSEEGETLGYLAGFTGMVVPYGDAWILAHRIHLLLKWAAEARKSSDADEARALLTGRVVPEWVRLTEKVRQTMLAYQQVVANRNDLGQLASMQNKYVRLALIRLRLSIRELLGELPAEMEQSYRAAIAPANSAARIFIPTRPGLLRKGESVRLTIVAPGGPAPGSVSLAVRAAGQKQWQERKAEHVSRRTWQATLGPFPGEIAFVDYLASRGDAHTTFQRCTVMG